MESIEQMIKRLCPKKQRLRNLEKDAIAVVKEADIRVLRINVGRHDTEGYASLHPRLRATRFARAFDLSGRAYGNFLTQIFTDLGELSQHCVYRCIVCVICVFIQRDVVVITY